MATSNIPWTQIQALSFDIYGTLIDWQKGLVDAALRTAIGPYLPQDRAEVYAQLCQREHIIEKEQPSMRKNGINALSLKQYAQDLGVPSKLSEYEIEHAAKQYGDAIGSFPAFADTVHGIQRLGKHYKLVPLSNIDRESLAGTLANGLKGCDFDACYIAQDIGSYKPDVRNFEYLLDHLRSEFGVESDRLCHVAQSLYHDHGATKKMGIRSVWIDRYGVMQSEGRREEAFKEEYGIQLRVESIGELADIVDEAFRKAM